MNANSKPRARAIRNWLHQATIALEHAGVTTPRLDAEVLLAHVLGVDRSWLIAHDEDEIPSDGARKCEALIARRLTREPVAYIVGRKEFYGRSFMVTPDVLIPRPESEGMIDLLKDIVPRGASSRQRVVDVGCGSGCLGISAKLELPELDVSLADISPGALTVAQKNATQLGADVTIVQSDLLAAFSPLPSSLFNLILANLPYVSRDWDASPEIAHEPSIALFAKDNGLQLIKKCIQQASQALSVGGYLLLEADPCQHEEIIEHGKRYGFDHVETREYVVALRH